MIVLLKPTSRSLFNALLIATICLTGPASVAWAQRRGKQPDRQTYRPPTLRVNSLRPPAVPAGEASDQADDVALTDTKRLADMVRDQAAAVAATPLEETSNRSPSTDSPAMIKPHRPLIEVGLVDLGGTEEETEVTRPVQASNRTAAAPRRDRSAIRPAAFQETQLPPPARDDESESQPADDAETSMQTRPAEIPPQPEAMDADDMVIDFGPAGAIHDSSCDGCADCGTLGCDSLGCDSLGCDSIGGCQAPWWRRWSNASLKMNSDAWFGSVELLLMFRKGDHLPALVTTSTSTDPDLAGQLDDADTQIIFGGDSLLKDMTAGGRFTLGTWLDHRQCRSLVLRGWFAGEESYGFNANQDTFPTIARPFFNVSDGQTPENDALLIAFPDRASGSISVGGSSDVYGADLQVRQYWYGKYGATVDFLYGYQFMRLDENLGISSVSTSLNDDFAPVGSLIAVTDTFDTENEFHGGQVGIASSYREGCWSFKGLLKTGFGSLRRRATRNGSTLTSIDGANAVDPNGLLVRSTNAGTYRDDTFGWVPELDLSLGWQRYPCFDVTFGYHIIAMTEALQVSGAIDPALAVNTSDPPTGQMRPSPTLHYQTFYVQGIHFGLQYIY